MTIARRGNGHEFRHTEHEGQNVTMGSDTPQMRTSMDIDPDLWAAGERAANTINTYLLLPWDDVCNKWIAISLADGSADGTLYDTKRDAVKHQNFEQQCGYLAFRNLMNGVTAYEVTIYLQFNRKAYKAGFRLPDPEAQGGGPDIPITAGIFDRVSGRKRASR